jgi:transaldolase
MFVHLRSNNFSVVSAKGAVRPEPALLTRKSMLSRDQRVAKTLRRLLMNAGKADGCVSLEVSPLLAHDTESTVAEAKDLYARAQRPIS